MQLVFVHGWSVTNTYTYGCLLDSFAKYAPPELDLQVTHLHLGNFVSFAGEANGDAIAKGMKQTIPLEVLPKLAKGERFACITHSTGEPVFRKQP